MHKTIFFYFTATCVESILISYDSVELQRKDYELLNLKAIRLFLGREFIMKKLSRVFAVLCLSLFGTSVFAGGSDCWGNCGADVSTDKIKQEKLEKEA